MEPYYPILIIDGLLLVIGVLLVVADTLLVSYGDCRIKVRCSDEEKDFVVKGGGTLLSALIENGMRVPASCGGRGSCGYCKVKVLSGAGQLLPTEEIFMSRQEKRDSIRLACQVKVKNDLVMEIPDFLLTVKNMVKNGTFDSKVKWRVKIDGLEPELPAGGRKKLKLKLSDHEENTICGILEQHGSDRSGLVPVLQEINRRENYLPETLMRWVSEQGGAPLSVIFRLASFYNTFSLTPRGKYTLTVCTGTACHVKGAARLVSSIQDELGLTAVGTTEDKLFTVNCVRCVGCCGLAPVVMVGGDIHGAMNPKKTIKLVETCRGAHAAETQSAAANN